MQLNMPMVVIAAKTERIATRLHDPEKQGMPDLIRHEADSILGCRRNYLPIHPH